jgi:hypothetical protein
LAEKVKEALTNTPAPSGAYKIASLLKCGALTGVSVLGTGSCFWQPEAWVTVRGLHGWQWSGMAVL